MKVLIVGPHTSPIITRLAENLRARSCDVLVASFDAEGVESVHNLGKFRGFKSYLMFGLINKVVRTFQPDIVHAHIVNHYGLMCLFQPKPVLIALWGSEIMLAPNEGPIVKRLIFRLLNWIVLKRSSWCHTSGVHVAIEADKQCKGSYKKTSVFYWGFPITKGGGDVDEIEYALKDEFGLEGDGFIVFPRGLSSVYAPDLVAEIVNKLKEKMADGRKIVVFKGFSSDEDVQYFSKLVDLNSIIYIDRLLTDDELYSVYDRTAAHFSVPTSDSLGGGVVEPALFGSYPFLSNIPSYIDYTSKYPAYVIKGVDESELSYVCDIVVEKKVGKSVRNKPEEYQIDKLMKEIFKLYNKVISRIER